MFLTATLGVYLFMLLARSTLPRYRIDMLVGYVWKILLYWTLALIITTLISHTFVVSA